jgi:hypothetical protein
MSNAAANNGKVKEAIGVFGDAKALEAAVDELEISAFDHTAMPVLATDTKDALIAYQYDRCPVAGYRPMVSILPLPRVTSIARCNGRPWGAMMQRFAALSGSATTFDADQCQSRWPLA